MGLLDKWDGKVFEDKFNQKCHACKKPFDNEDVFEEHKKDIHPFTKSCPKCQGTMGIVYPKSRAENVYGRDDGWFEYICSECGIVGERWATYDITKRMIVDDEE